MPDIHAGQIWRHREDGRLIHVLSIRYNSNGSCLVDSLNKRTGAPLEPYNAKAWARTFDLIQDREARMATQLAEGQTWERKDDPAQTVLVVERDWRDDDGEAYVRFNTLDGAHYLPVDRFLQEYQPMAAPPPRRHRTAFDALIDDDLLPPPPAPNEQVISSVTVTRRGNHDVVKVWNRGGLAGELTVCAGDGEEVQRRLLGGG